MREDCFSMREAGEVTEFLEMIIPVMTSKGKEVW
jgi:hypothetical protein